MLSTLHPASAPLLLQSPCVTLPVVDINSACLNTYLSIQAAFATHDPRDSACPNRKQCRYYKWFHPALARVSRHLCDTSLPILVRRDVVSFVVGSHAVPVNHSAGEVPFTDRTCPLCDGPGAPDELHLLLQCTRLSYLRLPYQQSCLASVHAPDSSSPFIYPVLTEFFAHPDSCHFVHDIMDGLRRHAAASEDDSSDDLGLDPFQVDEYAGLCSDDDSASSSA
jgi:hypothetical protein